MIYIIMLHIIDANIVLKKIQTSIPCCDLYNYGTHN